MPPKSKVEKSLHYKEIVELLLQGQSTRTISDYLKNTYNEDIGYGAINRFRNNHLNIAYEVKVRELTKQKQQQQLQKKREEQKQKKQEEQKQEAIFERAEIGSDVVVAKEKAINKLTQALHILEFFFGNYGKDAIIGLMSDDDVKQDSKVNLLLRAVKYYLDFYKDEKAEVNVNVPSFHELLNEDLLEELTDDEYAGNNGSDEDNS